MKLYKYNVLNYKSYHNNLQIVIRKMYILYLSILYLDIILSKDKLNLSSDKNLKFLCLCSLITTLAT